MTSAAGACAGASLIGFRARRLFVVVVAIGGALLRFAASGAGTDASLPIPRIETGAHSDFIKKLGVSGSGDLLLTASDDKTARIWRSSGLLQSVLRVPIVDGLDGQLYSGALSPDGRTAVIGGFFEDQGSSIYFYDATSGRYLRRLKNLAPAPVENLAFSPNGKLLAVLFGAGEGMMIFDLEGRKLIARDEAPTESIFGAEFAPNGDLAFTTFDGRLWSYRAADSYARSTVKNLRAGRPMHLRFSPDGREIAIGFDDQPSVSIVNTANLEEVYALTLPASAKQKGLHVVEWSSDGEYVYAAGEALDGFNAPIYRMNARGRGIPERIANATRRVTDMQMLPDGAIAFSSAEPEVGVLETTGRVRWRLRSNSVDPRREPSKFRISAHADVVAFAASATSIFFFDIFAPTESALRSNSELSDGVVAPVTDMQGWSIDTGPDRQHLRVNGTPVLLERHETVHSWAITPDRGAAVFGTSWSLHKVSAKGVDQWRRPMSADVGIVNISADGNLVVASLSDGTLRWYRSEDGAEVLALFAHRNGRDWIAWIPSGYYMSSLSGDNFIGWHVNRGQDNTPDFYRAVQFERVLYRPDVVQAWFRARGNVSLDKIVGPGAFNIAQLDSVAPPRLALSTRASVARNGRPALVASISGDTTSLPLQDWSLYLNGVPITPTLERTLGPAERHSFRREVELELPGRTNRLRVESNNGRALGFAELDVDATTAPQATPGDLYFVAVGVSEFVDPDLPDLKFASRDAVEFEKTFQSGFGRGFRNVKSLVLSDTTPLKATRANLEQLRAFLGPATGNDTVIVFLASHGISDAKGNYFFVPAEGTLKDMLAVQRGEVSAPSLVRWDFFVDLLRRTAGKRVLIVDTCSSGALGSTFDVHSLAKRSLSSSFALVAASKGTEKSQELDAQKHGLFTFGLLESLRTGFDPDTNGVVTLSEAFEFAFDKVQALRNRAVGQQTPQLSAPDVLANMPLVVMGSGARAVHRNRSEPEFGSGAKR